MTHFLVEMCRGFAIQSHIRTTLGNEKSSFRSFVMQLAVAYRGRSEIVRGPDGLAVSLAPNLRRERVSFAGTLRQPLRFREAISALHDVVISDLRYQPRDKSAYQAYL